VDSTISDSNGGVLCRGGRFSRWKHDEWDEFFEELEKWKDVVEEVRESQR